MSREVEELRRTLAQIQRSAQFLSDNAGDLHAQAWERASRGLEPAGRNRVGSAGPVGDPKAQTLWADLIAEAEEAGQTLQTLRVAILRYFSQGPDAERFPGSLISRGTHRAQLRYQGKRRKKPKDHYSAHNIYPQPHWGGGRNR